MKRTKISVILAVFSICLCSVVLVAATYAWFSSNQLVSTSRVEGHTDTSDVQLLISELGGEQFKGSQVSSIVQVNLSDSEKLLPVSTADLAVFLQNTNTLSDYAIGFTKVSDESRYYHGRVYIMAKAEGQRSDAHLLLYLDQSTSTGGALVNSDDKEQLMLNAARLGLVISDVSKPYIFYLSDEENPTANRMANTVIDGNVLEEGQVLTMQQDKIIAVPDPAVPLSQYSVSTSGGNTFVPQEPLCKLELNKVYQVDVYFYLEGCDPDCTDSISYDGSNLHLAFFGVLE